MLQKRSSQRYSNVDGVDLCCRGRRNIEALAGAGGVSLALHISKFDVVPVEDSMRRRSAIAACLFVGTLLGFDRTADAGKSIELILDASNSMNAQLPEGRTRIEAAKAAVDDIVNRLPPDVRISLRAYGHQSPTAKHDCKDTELMVGFSGLAANKSAILAKAHSIKAQGYTPITYVITLAAGDVGKEDARPRIVILVSDGKETCEGDPCAAAKALAAADASLVIHTIGFAVDTAAKYQLQCIAGVARGNYYDADSAGELATALGDAAKTEPPAPVAAAPPRTTTTITVAVPKPGKLALTNADISIHKVTEAETGNQVGTLSNLQTVIELPAGIYNVTFGNTVWKSIEVKAGETTTLNPGLIEVKHASLSGHTVTDAETGEEIGKITSLNSHLTVLPSTFNVLFGNALWKNIEVKAGEHVVLNPGTITVDGAPVNGVPIKDADGTVVATVSPFSKKAPLPAGKYTLEIGTQKVPVDLAEGQDVVINLR